MVDYQAFNSGLSSQGLTDFLTQSISEASAAESSTANHEELIKKYHSEELDESCLPSDPLSFFRHWFTQAIACGIGEANAMCLATVDPETMRPSARMVLLKELESECEEGATDVGFVFYTNYESRKSVDLERNPQAALTFFWRELSRSVRIEGPVEKVSESMSAAYFNSRPVGSRVSAVASQQSRPMASKRSFEELIAQLDAKTANRDPNSRVQLYQKTKTANRIKALTTPGNLPQAEQEQPEKPKHWGGWRVVPDRIEFWKGSTRRLHDRIVYSRNKNTGDWSLCRLQP